MISNMKIKSFHLIAGLFLLTSCTSETEALLENATGEVCFVIGQEKNVEIETRATYDVNDFNVSLKRGSTVIFSPRKFSEIADTTITCAAESDYLFTAESCTENEAENTNNYWGKARIAGEKTFEVIAEQENTVEVTCKQVNSSVQVKFSDFIKKLCPEYSITFYAVDNTERKFTLDQDNYNLKTAYFNVNESRALNYTITLTRSGVKHEYTGNQTLTPSGTYQLNIKMDDESFSIISIGISINGNLEQEVTLDAIEINPYI